MPKFRRKPVDAESVRSPRDAIIYTDKGQVNADPGDWLVTNLADEIYPVSHSIFLELYEPADEEARKYLERVKGWRFVEDRNGIVKKIS